MLFYVSAQSSNDSNGAAIHALAENLGVFSLNIFDGYESPNFI